MPDIYGPFDGGLPWAQAQWYRDAPSWAPSAVFGLPATRVTDGDLALAINGLDLTVGLGRAHVRGAGYERTGTPALFTAIPNTNAALSRRDRIVLRRDLAAKTVVPVLRQGTPAASPASPALLRDENGSWDLPLFSFLVGPNGSTVLTDVVDERAFLGESNVPTYVTTRARDLAEPSPAEQQIVGAAGKLWQRLSGKWRQIAGDTDWVDLPAIAPTKAGPEGMASRVIAGTCHVTISNLYSAGAYAANGHLGTLPEGHRPDRVRRFVGKYFGSDAVEIAVNTNGEIRVAQGSNGIVGGVLLNCSFPVAPVTS